MSTCNVTGCNNPSRVCYTTCESHDIRNYKHGVTPAYNEVSKGERVQMGATILAGLIANQDAYLTPKNCLDLTSLAGRLVNEIIKATD